MQKNPPRPEERSGKRQKGTKQTPNCPDKISQTKLCLPKVVISKGMLNMNSIAMQNKVCEKQVNLKCKEIPTDVNLPFDNYCNSNILVKHLDLTHFKTVQCQNTKEHEYRQCPFYHGPCDRRRKMIYRPELCESVKNGAQCPRMDRCPDSHNIVEQIYNQIKYKTKFCKYYPDRIDQCEYGCFCPCAHSEEDIQTQLICQLELDADFFMFYYKTSCCPYANIPHDQNCCLYAHCAAEYRRKIEQFFFHPVQCEQIKQNKKCPSGLNCQFSHNQNEVDFHPHVYKTRQCPKLQQCGKLNCPYFHCQDDMREISQEINSGIFKIVPKNRQVEGSFKQKSPPRCTFQGVQQCQQFK